MCNVTLTCLSVKHRLRVFQIKVLKRIFVHKQDRDFREELRKPTFLLYRFPSPTDILFWLLFLLYFIYVKNFSTNPVYVMFVRRNVKFLHCHCVCNCLYTKGVL
jgi:hypothetical protein